MKIIRLFFCLFFFLTLFSCSYSEKEQEKAIPPQWEALRQGLTALYHKNIPGFLSRVDSTQLNPENRDVLVRGFRQKFLSDDMPDSLMFDLSEIIDTDDEHSEVYYKIYNDGSDTTYSMQRVVFRDGQWRICLY